MREILVKNYPCIEIINSDALVLGAVIEQAGYEVEFLSLQNVFKSFEDRQRGQLEELLGEYHPNYVIFHTDYYIAFTSTAVFYSVKMITEYYKRTFPYTKFILVGRNGLVMKEKIFDLDKNIDVVMKRECEVVKGIANSLISGSLTAWLACDLKSTETFKETMA